MWLNELFWLLNNEYVIVVIIVPNSATVAEFNSATVAEFGDCRQCGQGFRRPCCVFSHLHCLNLKETDNYKKISQSCIGTILTVCLAFCQLSFPLNQHGMVGTVRPGVEVTKIAEERIGNWREEMKELGKERLRNNETLWILYCNEWHVISQKHCRKV